MPHTCNGVWFFYLNNCFQEHAKRLANEALADDYLAAKFDTTEVAEEKNAIVAVEEQSRAMALEAAVPMWLRVGAIVQARIVKADCAFCCAPVRIPKPGVPFAVCSTSTSITIEWDVESLIGDASNGGEFPPIEYVGARLDSARVGGEQVSVRTSSSLIAVLFAQTAAHDVATGTFRCRFVMPVCLGSKTLGRLCHWRKT